MRLVLLLALFSLPLLTPASAQADFGAHLGGHFGYGKMGCEETTANQTRDMGTFDLQAMPGLRTMGNSVLVGLMLDYRFMAQLATVANDFSGRSFLIGVGGVYEFSLLKVLVGYDFRARHYSTGPTTIFKGSGYRILLGYKILPSTTVDLQYVITNYNAALQNGAEEGLGTRPVKHWNLGFGLSLSF